MHKDWVTNILPRGHLYIVEVLSRLNDKAKFIKFVCKFGYKINESKNLGKDFFIYLQFNRVAIVDIDVGESDLLAPCMYKKR